MMEIYKQLAVIFVTLIKDIFGNDGVPTRTKWLKAKNVGAKLSNPGFNMVDYILGCTNYKAFVLTCGERVKAILDDAGDQHLAEAVLLAAEVRLNVNYSKPTDPLHKKFWEYAAVMLITLDSNNKCVLPEVGTIRYIQGTSEGFWVIYDHNSKPQKVNKEFVHFDNPFDALNSLLGCRRSVPVISQRPW